MTTATPQRQPDLADATYDIDGGQQLVSRG
jgi:hypothetical protein